MCFSVQALKSFFLCFRTRSKKVFVHFGVKTNNVFVFLREEVKNVYLLFGVKTKNVFIRFGLKTMNDFLHFTFLHLPTSYHIPLIQKSHFTNNFKMNIFHKQILHFIINVIEVFFLISDSIIFPSLLSVDLFFVTVQLNQ